MPPPDLILVFVRVLNRARLRYVVGGSVAAMFYGEPRLTNDVDVVVFLPHRDVARLPDLFPSPDFYVPPMEALLREAARPAGGHFNIIQTSTSFKADIYPAGRDELNAWAFRNTRRVEYDGEPLVLAPPEYVIVRKLEYFRAGGSEKHIRDIAGMLEVSGQQLDQEALGAWIGQLGLEAEWQRAKSYRRGGG